MSEPKEEIIEMKKVQHVIEVRQAGWLKEAAAERAGERRSGRLDASEILREAIDEWHERREAKKQKKR